MPQETMTSRQRWLAVLNGQKPDRIPMDYWSTPEVTTRLMKELNCGDETELWRQLHIDRVVRVSGRYVGPPLPEGQDEFGLKYRRISYGENAGVYDEVENHSLAEFESVEQIDREYTWPKADWWDYSDVSSQVERNRDRIIRGGGSEPFLRYCYLRGMERAFMDLIDAPEIAHYCLDKLFDLAYENTRRTIEAADGQVHMVYVAEDMGSQEDLMFSPGQIEEFLVPRMKRMIDLAHSAGAFVFHHSDGAIRRIIPRMIEIGIDVLNPIQWRCKGMAREGLKRDFGDQVIFHGAVDNQQTLPFGSAGDVEQEVLENIRILGEGGGYILAPCHNIQPITPTENILALYRTGYEAGWR